ncbi:hypothetical protein AXK59_07410 [Tsukamurella tyrosinosolvens]|nr:hypothetical protein AXK59_07410 [Tsukamurella tyrosinosolvens]
MLGRNLHMNAMIALAIAVPVIAVAAYFLYRWLGTRENPKKAALTAGFAASCLVLVMTPFQKFPISLIIAVLLVVTFGVLIREAVRVANGQPAHGVDSPGE